MKSMKYIVAVLASVLFLSACNQSKQKTFRGCIFQWSDDDNIKQILAGLQNNVKIKQQTVLQYNLDGVLTPATATALLISC